MLVPRTERMRGLTATPNSTSVKFVANRAKIGYKEKVKEWNGKFFSIFIEMLVRTKFSTKYPLNQQQDQETIQHH
jgi:hypothetical protein